MSSSTAPAEARAGGRVAALAPLAASGLVSAIQRLRDVHFERLMDRAELAQRDPTAVPRRVRRTAARLEHLCRDAAYNWFNFHDFCDVGETLR
jgi:predicted LPLAT superfamily acyltransferase